MAIIPKNRKYRHSFRNKPKTHSTQGLPLRPLCAKIAFADSKAWSVKPIANLLFATDIQSTILETQTLQTAEQERAQTAIVQLTPLFSGVNLNNKPGLSHNPLLFGTHAIIFQQATKLSAKLLSTLKLVIARTLQKRGRAWLRLCCDTPVSARPAETRMGKGKGLVSYWETQVQPGTVFLEFHGVETQKLQTLFYKIQKKVGIPLKLVSR